MKEFAQTILSTIKDSQAFTNQREVETEEKLKSAYLNFAEKFNLNLDISVRGMRSGLGALCEASPNSYLIVSNSGESVEIWITPARYKGPMYPKPVDSVQVMMPAIFKDTRNELANELRKVGLRVVTVD